MTGKKEEIKDIVKNNNDVTEKPTTEKTQIPKEPKEDSKDPSSARWYYDNGETIIIFDEIENLVINQAIMNHNKEADLENLLLSIKFDYPSGRHQVVTIQGNFDSLAAARSRLLRALLPAFRPGSVPLRNIEHK